jgi:hypothetical protein
MIVDGKPYFWKRGELYSSPYIDQRPNIPFIWKGMKWGADAALQNRFLESVNNTCHLMGNGFHRMEAMLVAYGLDNRTCGSFSRAQFQDIMPIALHSLEQAIPSAI